MLRAWVAAISGFDVGLAGGSAPYDKYKLDVISALAYIEGMAWTVLEHPDFSAERADFPEDVLDKLAEIILVLEREGPQLGRPHADTLNGSKHRNMKELRLAVKGAWRFAFAFDPERAAVILVGGNKEGGSSAKFYRSLIRIADERFDEWLETEE